MKKLVIAFGIVMVAAASQASYLWFTVNNDDTGYSNISSYLTSLKEAGTISGIDDIYVGIVADNGTSKTTLYTDTPLTSEWQIAPAQANVDLSSLTGDLNSYSFYVEIASSKAGVYNPVGTGASQTYTALNTAGYVSESMSEVPAVGVWHSGGYKATPEPTSAMLMLLGVAGLALKRKQKKA